MMEQPIAPGAVTAAHIKAAMLGASVAGMQVVRQAWRISASDSDELAIIRVGSAWWMAQRMSDRLTFWAYPGDDEAWDGFDARLREDADAGCGWRESTPDTVAG